MKMKEMAAGFLTAALLMTGGTAVSNAAALMPAPVISGSLSADAQFTLAGGRHLNEQQRDARDKYNPNTGIVSQMLGGAKSLDLEGQERGGISSRHYAWCAHQYGSYRISDNSFCDVFRKPGHMLLTLFR